MKLWLKSLTDPVPGGLKTPEETARFELTHALPDARISLQCQENMGDGV